MSHTWHANLLIKITLLLSSFDKKIRRCDRQPLHLGTPHILVLCTTGTCSQLLSPMWSQTSYQKPLRPINAWGQTLIQWQANGINVTVTALQSHCWRDEDRWRWNKCNSSTHDEVLVAVRSRLALAAAARWRRSPGLASPAARNCWLRRSSRRWEGEKIRSPASSIHLMSCRRHSDEVTTYPIKFRLKPPAFYH